MAKKIIKDELISLTQSFSYRSYGDHYEKTHGHLIINHFPNIEIFWRDYITLITKRIENPHSEPSVYIHQRDRISQDLRDLASYHYSVFKNLLYAEDCLKNKHMSYFENFYAHLGSACDLAEEFFITLYFIALECDGKKTRILEKMSEGEFIALAKKWYKEHYASSYEHYLRKGKAKSANLITREDIVGEFFHKSSIWKAYFTTANQIRAYRNVVVHNTQIGYINDGGRDYVPKRAVIQNYKKWQQVFSATPERRRLDFVFRDEQMRTDLTELKERLNALWVKPLREINRLIYIDANSNMLAKYDIEF